MFKIKLQNGTSRMDMKLSTGFKRRVLAVALVFSLLSLCTAAEAASASFAKDGVTYKKIMKQPISKCDDGEVLTHQGTTYSCVPNFKPSNCNATYGAVKEIHADGSVTCVNAEKEMECPAGEVLTGRAGANRCVRIFPECSPDEVLTSPDGQNYVCLPTTQSFTENVNAVLNKLHGWCNSETLLTQAGDYGGVFVFSSWCSSACSRYCAKKKVHGVDAFSSGYVVDVEGLGGPSGGIKATCACVR